MSEANPIFPKKNQERREDVPEGKELYALHSSGKTYDDLGIMFDCSSSLIHKRIKEFRNEHLPSSRGLSIEANALGKCLELLEQLRENVDVLAAIRVVNHLLEFYNDYEQSAHSRSTN